MTQIRQSRRGINCILTFLLLFVIDYARPCSMFKISLFGKTMVGNNEDAWSGNVCCGTLLPAIPEQLSSIPSDLEHGQLCSASVFIRLLDSIHYILILRIFVSGL